MAGMHDQGAHGFDEACDDHGYAEWVANEDRIYTGETLDIASRACVRRTVTRYLRSEPWCGWWVGMSRAPRQSLIMDCARAICRHWARKEGAGTVECWTFQAIDEEVDFFLPKAFWREKRGYKRAASKVSIDPGWPTFLKWSFRYGETAERLAAERRAMDVRGR